MNFRKNEHNYNKYAKELSYQPGEKVWLWVPSKAEGLTKKLTHGWRGPYVIENVKDTHCVLITEEAERIHKVVHMNRLRLCYDAKRKPESKKPMFLKDGDDDLREEDLPNSPREVEEDDIDIDIELDADEFEVDFIVRDRKFKDKRSGKQSTQYLIRWKGYDSSEDTWVNEEDLSCPDKLNEFKETQGK